MSLLVKEYGSVNPLLLFLLLAYSRPDIDFVRHLFDQLKAQDPGPWADWPDIPPTANWLTEIYICSPENLNQTFSGRDDR